MAKSRMPQEASSDAIASRAVVGQRKQQPSELWAYYERLVAKFEGERPCVYAKIDALRVPVEDAHREEWEARQRRSEIADLQDQVLLSESRLAERQEKLVRQANDNDQLRAQAPCWEADLEHVRSSTGARVEGVRFAPGAVPERVGGFPGCAKANSSSRAASAARGSSPSGTGVGTVRVEYAPNDHESLRNNYVATLERRLVRERESHANAHQTLEELRKVEAHESELLLTTLRESVTRAKRNRGKVRVEADEVMRWHLKLQAEHATLNDNYPKEVAQLRECNEVLLRRVGELAAQRDEECTKAVQAARRREAVIAESNVSGALCAREDSTALQEEIETLELRSARRTRALSDQLQTLQTRYAHLEKDRASQLAALRSDVEGLMRATNQCEKLAARCVSADLAGAIDATLAPGGGGGALPLPTRGCCCTPATPIEALALRPALARLRHALEQCEAAAGEEKQRMEEEGHSGMPVSQSSSAETYDSQISITIPTMSEE